MSKANKYFSEASSHFLTEQLTYEQFDKILNDGECLPTCKDYEDWDVDHLEQCIKDVATSIEKEAFRNEELDLLKEQNKKLIERLKESHKAIDEATDGLLEIYGESIKDSNPYLLLACEICPNEELLTSLNQ